MSVLLRQGSRGPDVRKVQEQLNAAGGSRRAPLVADGIFGAHTKLRVQEFQHARGLGSDGVVGPMTRAALEGRPGAGGNGAAGGGAGAGTMGGRPQTGSNADVANVASRIVAAARSAHSTWRSTATIGPLIVNAPLAIGVKGCVSGPSLGPGIASAAAGMPPREREIGLAAAAGISSSFQRLQGSISVPGLPWYPGLASWPGPAAPPLPNQPTPLMMSVGATGAVSVGNLSDAMELEYGGSDPRAATIFHLIAVQLAAHFIGWIGSATIRNVLGHGPVPTYAPPVIMAGPVIGGSTISSGGHF